MKFEFFKILLRESKGLNDNYLYHTDCFFIPKENILFIREICGNYEVYEIVKKEDILKEAVSLAEGADPYRNERWPNVVGIPDFSNIKRFEYNDDRKIREILRDINDKDNLLKKIELEIEGLMKKFNKH